jgi:hypothetical protein
VKETISAETVTETWQRMAQMSLDEVHVIPERMKEEQPYLLVHLLALDDTLFDQNDRETILYVGMVVWQILRQSKQRLGQVTRKKLKRAENANYEMLEFLASDTEADFMSASEIMVQDYPEPEVLRYIVEAIMEDDEEVDPDNPAIRDEVKGMAFVHLKIALDALIQSLHK